MTNVCHSPLSGIHRSEPAGKRSPGMNGHSRTRQHARREGAPGDVCPGARATRGSVSVGAVIGVVPFPAPPATTFSSRGPVAVAAPKSSGKGESSGRDEKLSGHHSSRNLWLPRRRTMGASRDDLPLRSARTHRQQEQHQYALRSRVDVANREHGGEGSANRQAQKEKGCRVAESPSLRIEGDYAARASRAGSCRAAMQLRGRDPNLPATESLAANPCMSRETGGAWQRRGNFLLPAVANVS